MNGDAMLTVLGKKDENGGNGGCSGCAFSDDFNRSNGGLGADWSTTHGGGGATPFVINNNKAQLNGNPSEGSWNVPYTWYVCPCDSDDHEVYGETALPSNPSGWTSILARGDGAGTCYLVLKCGSGSSGYNAIRKMINYAHTTLDSSGSVSLNNMKLVVNGTSITSGTLSTTNSDITTGKRMGFTAASPASNTISTVDNWQTGHVGDL